jgi:hypothetical protein
MSVPSHAAETRSATLRVFPEYEWYIMQVFIFSRSFNAHMDNW